MPMSTASIGALCVGIVTMYWVKYYHKRMKGIVDIKTLSSLLAILFGGTVLNYIKMDQNAFWYYPIGLFVGLVLYIILALLCGGDPEIVAFKKDED